MAAPLETIAAVPNQIINAADSVIATGETSKFDLTLTLFGRKIGVNVEVFLLAKDGPKP